MCLRVKEREITAARLPRDFLISNPFTDTRRRKTQHTRQEGVCLSVCWCVSRGAARSHDRLLSDTLYCTLIHHSWQRAAGTVCEDKDIFRSFTGVRVQIPHGENTPIPVLDSQLNVRKGPCHCFYIWLMYHKGVWGKGECLCNRVKL